MDKARKQKEYSIPWGSWRIQRNSMLLLDLESGQVANTHIVMFEENATQSREARLDPITEAPHPPPFYIK